MVMVLAGRLEGGFIVVILLRHAGVQAYGHSITNTLNLLFHQRLPVCVCV